MTIKAKKSKINLREKLAELLNFRQIRDRLDGLGLYLGKDRTGTAENLAVRGGANVDDLQLAEISAAVGGTAVDVFVYDTRNDSDGGKWRERTSHTSWYNEELNTATRGGRREFPAVAVIVAESNKVTIYDGDDPDLNMWMVFNQINYNGSSNTSCVAFLNGILVFGRNVGFPVWNFIKDREGIRTDSSLIYQTNVSLRNEASNGSILTTAGSPSIINNNINDVAMTVLPNAPIDADTGLPIPTIAVATDGGISVIKDDGSVVDSSYGNVFNRAGFKDSVLYVTRGTQIETWRFDNYQVDGFTGEAYHVGSIPTSLGGQNNAHSVEGDNIEMGSANGLGRIYENKTNLNEGMIAYTTSSYNTGWMPGDIKLATLSDTKIEKVGVDESTELVTNGGFLSDVSGWDSGSYGASINISHDASQQAKVEVVSGNAIFIHQQLSGLKVGKKYTFSAVVTPQVGATYPWWLFLGNTISTEFEVGYNSLTNGTQNIFSIDFIATSETQDVGLGQNSTGITTGEYILIDNISVKQTGELITNGTFDNGTEGWSDDGTSTIAWNSSGYIDIDRNGSSSFAGRLTAQQTVSGLKVGKKYIASADVIALNVKFNLSVYTGETLLVEGPELTSVGVATIEFIATSESHIIGLGCRGTTSATATVDNVSLRLAEDDRSVNDNGLQVFGEIDKSPVTPGADLVAYSGFSANNYLVQPYNSDLDFGTGDFCVMGWFKRHSNSTVDRIWNRSDDVNNHRVEFYGLSTGDQVGFYTRDDSSYTHVVGTLPLNVWTHLVRIRESGTLKIYNNGILENSVTGDIRDLTSENNALLEVGKASFDGKVFDGSIALFKISATVPTDDQIAKIYRDEKVLFTDGAQATLYGTSDAVTALAYDDKTELLHVGTSGGRSDFAGLRRINNTTTAVTTSISASNNLIAEQ